MSTSAAAAEGEAAAAPGVRLEKRHIVYDDGISRLFIGASVIFALVAMLVGVLVALQLAFHPANIAPLLTFGRLRPLHTNAAIFAFVGNMVFAGIYYSTQRLTKARMASRTLSLAHFWGWQLIIVSAAITLPLGISSGKEYAELEWPIDIAIALVWVIFAINFFATLWKRNEKQMYVALWFYIASIITVAVLHIVNSLALPVSILKSYSIYSGAQDALVQWWYGHNAVAFFLTTPVLGIMYYYLPKAANRPVFSYRLSIVHFWALVFVYIWAGPHHLLNTALPDWAQTLGMIFSLMLWAPSWGGMLNGLMTLRGAWAQVRRDPVLKFFAAGVTFYGMATFEGPLLSIKGVSALAHYTDWIIGHVHAGALGWNGFMAAGMFYWMVPKLFGTKLHSERAANIHFWLGTAGIILYVVSMWVAGITQGLMWRATDAKGSLLYPNFIETLTALKGMYWTRIIGGTVYLVGMLMMAWNLFMTAKAGKAVDGEAEVVVEVSDAPSVPWTRIVFGGPVVVSVIVLVVLGAIALTNAVGAGAFMLLALAIAVMAIMIGQRKKDPTKPGWHALVEGRAFLFSVFTVIAVLIGGAAEIIPSLIIKQTDAAVLAAKHPPYSALELEGRDVYIREGCYNCHSQLIRPFKWEAQRYGEPNTLDDSRWDHPFQWGSKRTGPDLARVGGKYPNVWHWQHMIDPRTISPGSNMPSYTHLPTATVDFAGTKEKVYAMKTLGVPYSDAQINGAQASAQAQAAEIVADLKGAGIAANPNCQLVALTAFLQRLGKPPTPKPAPTTLPVTVNDKPADAPAPTAATH
ncbi:MAG: cytochrome-c oxidase, cbb3-type subunit I [Myxococcales bacterium]|nr:cytochrome-c oxidase, cbb3-type subunit I [Myxococcales bacterium]